MDIYAETNFFVERQCRLFWNDVQRLQSSCHFQSMLRQMDTLIPQNFTVKCVEDVRKICGADTPCLFLEFMDRAREMLHDFRAEVHLPLCQYYHDPHIQQLVEASEKKARPSKGQTQGAGADTERDVVQLAREVQFNMTGLDEVLGKWEKLLDEKVIHTECFDEESESINKVESERYMNVLRTVVDIHGKMVMALQMAVAWRTKATIIREELDGDPQSKGRSAPSLEGGAGVKPAKKKEASSKQPAAPKPRAKNAAKPAPVNARKNPGKSERAAKGSPAQSQDDLSHLDQAEPGSAEAEESSLKKANGRGKDGTSPDGLNEAADGKGGDGSLGQKPEIRMNKRQKKARPVVGNSGSAGQREDDPGERNPEPGSEVNEEEEGSTVVTVTQLPELKANPRAKKKLDAGSSNRASAESERGVKMPPIHGPDSTGRDNRRAPRESEVAREQAEGGTGVNDGSLNTSPSEQDLVSEADLSDLQPSTWQEKMLDKLSRRQKELTGNIESQAKDLTVNICRTNRLVELRYKHKGNRLSKQKLQDMVKVCSLAAEEIKKAFAELENERHLLTPELEQKIKVNESVCREEFIAKIKAEKAYMESKAKEVGDKLKKHLSELASNAEAIDVLPCFGLPTEEELEFSEARYGLLGRYGFPYGYGLRDLGGSLPSLRSFQLLRDEDLFARGYRSRYDRALWEAMRFDAADRMSLMSLDDSSPYPYRGLDESFDGSQLSRARKNQGDDLDSSSQSRGDSDYEQSKYPQMYDQKRDDKQGSGFYPS